MQYQIGDFLKRVRVPVAINDNTNYRLVTIRMNHKGVVLRETKEGSLIGSKTMYRVAEGQFILSGIDARNGAFGIVPAELDGAVVTNDFWYFDIDDSIIDKGYFLYLTSTNFFDNICRLASDGTTNRVRLQADRFYKYEISLPSVDEQRERLKGLTDATRRTKVIQTELQTQQTLLTQLRQAILQEAVQGKLTEKWRAESEGLEPTETGSILLARIRAEKAELIRQGKLRKEKPLPPITDAEKPFELPEGWVWCRIEEVCLSITDCVNKTAPIVSVMTPFKMLRTTNIRNGKVDSENVRYVSEETFLKWTRRDKPLVGDIILTREAPLGEVAIVENDDFIFLGQRLVQYRTNPELIDNLFLFFLFQSSVIQQQFHKLSAGAFVKHLRVPDSKNLLIPLPPLTIQKRITAQVKFSLDQVSRLEIENKLQQAEVGRLMQAVLREAFAAKDEVLEH